MPHAATKFGRLGSQEGLFAEKFELAAGKDFAEALREARARVAIRAVLEGEAKATEPDALGSTDVNLLADQRPRLRRNCNQ